jgi:hypothetical protein
MKLTTLQVKNFKGIGETVCEIRIDRIVVLVGQNNVGKSTVLDAYEAFATAGRELDENFFHQHDTGRPIEIGALFSDVTTADEEVLGAKWTFDHPEFGRCIRVKWVWDKPGKKATKNSYNPETDDFEVGGMGGWDSLLQSRIPVPLRISPTDPIEITQTKVVGMLKEHVKARLKEDSDSAKSVMDELDILAKKLFDETKAQLETISNKISFNVSKAFPGTTIELVPRSKESIDEKIVGADSFLRVGGNGCVATPLLLQGTGIQRALLWSALAVMADVDMGKKKKSQAEVKRILLIDEPEAFLHPPTVRDARDSLYDFAINNPDWQVIATTHSPVFIDLSKNHTTIVRVDPTQASQKYVSTDKISFETNERERLQMIRACNPIVNEFFFYDDIVLVEGPTEQLIVQHLEPILGRKIHVINCLGKANIPLFAKILNQFKVKYLVIHDSDTPFVARKGKMVNSGTWTLNEKIRNVVNAEPGCEVFTQFPHFEGEFLQEELSGGKVDRVLEVLADKGGDENSRVLMTYLAVLAKDAKYLTTSYAAFEAKQQAYIEVNGLLNDPRWNQSSSSETTTVS